MSLLPGRAPVHPIARRCAHVRVLLVSHSPGGGGAALARVPHVWHVHEFGREDLGLRNLLGDGMGIHVMGALSSRVVACSGAVAAKLARHVSPEKIRVVYGAPEIDPPGPAEAAPLP